MTATPPVPRRARRPTSSPEAERRDPRHRRPWVALVDGNAHQIGVIRTRWGLAGAEAILKLRALTSNGDFDEYWKYHLTQERHRIHETRYANNIILQAA